MDLIPLISGLAALVIIVSAALTWRAVRRSRRIASLELVAGPIRAGWYDHGHGDRRHELNIELAVDARDILLLKLGSCTVVARVPRSSVTGIEVLNHGKLLGSEVDVATVTSALDSPGYEDTYVLRAAMRRSEWVTVITWSAGELRLIHNNYDPAIRSQRFVRRHLPGDGDS